MSELRKALTSITGSALLENVIEPAINEELLKLQPLLSLLEVEEASGKTHEYRVRTSHPKGWFEGETTPANFKNSTYIRKAVQLKILRNWGSVSGFLKALTPRQLDVLTAEIMGAVEGIGNSLEFGILWGCTDDTGVFTGDPYQFTGLYPHLLANVPGNVINAGGSGVSLELLDEALAKLIGYRGVAADPKAWVMSLRMRQIVDGLQVRIGMQIDTEEIAEGRFVMRAYGNAPIYESDFVAPTSVSPAVSTGTAASGGALADGTYNYRIASVTLFGEQVAGSPLGSGVAVSGSTKTVNIAWTPDPNAVLYMIFRKKDTGAYALLDIIPALTYDADGAVIGSVSTYSDNGSKTPIAGIEPLEQGEQTIFLINRQPQRGVALLSKIDDMGQPVDNIVSFVELARTKDTYDFMLKAYAALKVVYPNVAGAVIRRVKAQAAA